MVWPTLGSRTAKEQEQEQGCFLLSQYHYINLISTGFQSPLWLVSFLLLFPNCFSNLLIPPPCFFVSAWSFCHSTYALSRFRHYTFHLLPVIMYTQAFPFLLSLPYLRPWICTPHMSFLPSASIHALLARTFLCQVFVSFNHMSITSSLCFGTHSSLEITLMIRTLALSSCLTII